MRSGTTKLAILSPSLVLTSAYAITGILPQLKAGLSLTQEQSEYLVTSPSIVVLIMVVLSPWIQRWLHRSDKQMIVTGLVIIGLAGMAPLIFHQYLAILIARMFLGVGIGLYNSQAISILANWYQANELATMIGWHAAFEELGQALTVSIASLLMLIGGWQTSFWTYGLSWLILLFFARNVKNDKVDNVQSDKSTNGKIGKLNPRVFYLMLMALLILTAYVAMENRFPALAVYLHGGHYNGAGKFLSLMLVGSTIGGLTYGWLSNQLGDALIYLALAMLAIADLIFAMFANHFVLVALAIILQGFPLQLISPWFFDQLAGIVTRQQRSLANSIVLVGFNLGAFISPSVTLWLNHLLKRPVGGTGLAAPFFVYSGMLVLMMIVIWWQRKIKSMNG